MSTLSDSQYYAGLFDTDGSLYSSMKLRRQQEQNRTFQLHTNLVIATISYKEAPYFAGIFDGDGSIYSTVRLRKGHCGIQSEIHMHGVYSEGIDAIICDLLDMGYDIRLVFDKREGQLPSCSIFLRERENIKQFLEWIRLFSRLKRDQIEWWLNKIYPMYRTRKQSFPSSPSRTKKELVELASVVLELSKMKKTINAGKIKWTPEEVEKWCDKNGIK